MGKEITPHVEAPTIAASNASSTHPAKRARVARASIVGVLTDFLLEPFADRVVIVVAQLDKIGTMVEAKWEGDIARGTFSVKLVSGRRDENIATMVGRRIVEIMREDGCVLPLLLSVALKERIEEGGEEEKEIVDGIVRTIVENKVWHRST